MSPSAKRSRGTRLDPFARPLDHALERLRVHGLPYSGHPERVSVWRSVCPSCRIGEWCLTLREHGHGGSIDLRCSVGCTDSEIRVALERDPAERRIEAAEAREARAWEVVGQLRTLTVRALELVASVHSGRALDEPGAAA